MSRVATRPLNEGAVQAADDEIYRRHAGDPRPNPLYDAEGNRLPLSDSDPAQADLRSEWMDLYEANGGEVEDSEAASGREPEATEEPCPLAKQLINARWEHPTVKCGDAIAMLADTRNIAAGTPANYSVKKVSDNSEVTTAEVNSEAASIRAEWASQKWDNAWPETPEVKFTVACDGLTADSAEPHLAFHRYANIARTAYDQDISANGFLIQQRTLVELNDRVLIIHVPVKLRKCGRLPRRRKNEEWGTWAARWNPGAYESPRDDVSASDKTNLKNAIEAHYSRKIAVHRRNCARHASGCPDPVARKCCKFEIRVQVHFYNMNDATAPANAIQVNYWNDSERANAANWFATDYPADNWVFAHEVGHLMGFYDEYTDGATDSTAGSSWQNVRAFTIPTLMNGLAPQSLRTYYFDHFATWLGDASRTNEPWAPVTHT